MTLREEGGYQLIHRCIPRDITSKKQFPDYEPDVDYGGYPKESGIAWGIWISREPTHYYDCRTGLMHSLEDDTVVNPWKFGHGRAVLANHIYKPLEELKASLNSVPADSLI